MADVERVRERRGQVRGLREAQGSDEKEEKKEEQDADVPAPAAIRRRGNNQNRETLEEAMAQILQPGVEPTWENVVAALLRRVQRLFWVPEIRQVPRAENADDEKNGEYPLNVVFMHGIRGGRNTWKDREAPKSMCQYLRDAFPLANILKIEYRSDYVDVWENSTAPLLNRACLFSHS